MGVEIVILSGARQGECLAFDANQLRIGDRPDCELSFDPAVDVSARDRSALLRLEDDGWRIHNTGFGEILVNEQAVAGQARIRSGDVIRMSHDGPDFSFHLVARSSGATAESDLPQSRMDIPVRQHTTDRNVHPTGTSLPAARPDAAPVPHGAASPAGDEESHAEFRFPWTFFSFPANVAAVGAAAVLLLAWVFWPSGTKVDQRAAEAPLAQTEPEAPVADPVLEARARDGEPVKENGVAAAAAEKENGDGVLNQHRPNADLGPRSRGVELIPRGPNAVGPTNTSGPRDEVSDTNSRTSSESAAAAVARIAPALLLFQVQDPKSESVWPFATGFAIDEKTVLTSATVATELAKFREKGWSVWAVSLAAGAKHAVEGIRIHVGSAETGAEPQNKVYFDIGLVTVSGPLPAAAALASAGELQELESGYPVACVGIPHDGEPINRFQGFSVQSAEGKVFVITSLPPSGGPRLLHFKATVPANVFGSPVVNAQGEVVAIYSGSAAAADSGAESLNLRYAVVIEPGLVDLWQKNQSDKIWVPPQQLTTDN